MHILGMGYCHPSTVIDNQFLEDLEIGSGAQWIVDKIGILERRSTLPLDYIKETKNADPRAAVALMEYTPAEMGIAAARMALQRAEVEPDQLGLVICNSCTPLGTAPAVAQEIARGLRVDAAAYDVFTACPVFALHLRHLLNFSIDQLPEYVLCVSTASLTQKVNYQDRSDSAIWGDGAAAWVVSRRHAGRLAVEKASFTADPLRCQAVVVDSFGHFHQDGRAVRDFSVRQTVRMIRRLETERDLEWSRDVFIGHQANATMLEQIRNNRKIPPENHWHNVEYIGNQAGAGAPAVLAMHWDQITVPQNIVVAVVGAGLSWGAVLLRAA